MNRNSPARRLAFCGVWAAVCVVLQLGGSFVPGLTYCGPLLGILVLGCVCTLCGMKYGLGTWAAASAVGLLICPNPECSILFLLSGWYPAVKPLFDRIPSAPLRMTVKLLSLNFSVCGAYGAIVLLFFTEDAIRPLLLVAAFLLANVCFILADKLLERAAIWSIRKFGKYV